MEQENNTFADFSTEKLLFITVSRSDSAIFAENIVFIYYDKKKKEKEQKFFLNAGFLEERGDKSNC